MRRGGEHSAVDRGSGARNERGVSYQKHEHYGYQRGSAGRHSHPNHVEEEGVEVVLDDGQTTTVMEEPSRSRGLPVQNVFRGTPSSNADALRPRAVRPPGGQPLPPMADGLYGHGPPLPPPGYPPYQVPYNPSGSFEEQGGSPYHHPQQHYSPQVQYPTGTRHPSEDVNVISPPHGKLTDSRPPRNSGQGRPPQQYYQYPPASPVSRPGTSPHSRDTSPRKNHSSRPEGPYTAAQRKSGNKAYHPDDGTWNNYPPAASSGSQPPLVTESSFDSDHYTSSQYSSHPPTPGDHPMTPGAGQPMIPGSFYDPNQLYGGGSWGSFDSTGGGGQPPPQFDDQRYYGYPPSSPYPPYSPSGAVGYYGEPAAAYSYGPPLGQSFEEEDAYHHQHYQQHQDHHDPYKAATVTPGDNRKSSSSSPQTDSTPVQSNRSDSCMLLPQAAYEVDFEVTAPPFEPILPPSHYPLCHSPAEINENDVLCGRGGGTNSQVGNRRFRKLVQEFQPTYLLARRKEKPLLARTIVLIIRKRGGRFLKKNEDTGEFFEVGDLKAEAKTSQALREGLDVRATKSAASSLLDKKKKKKGSGKDTEGSDSEKDSPRNDDSPKEKKSDKEPKKEKDDQERAKTPPPHIPALKEGESVRSGIIHPPSPHSPGPLQFRKRRRMRSKENSIPPADNLFADFCPPRADLCRANSPDLDGQTTMNLATPPSRNGGGVDNDQQARGCNPGCTGIAMEMVLGAAGGLCLGPKWEGSK